MNRAKYRGRLAPSPTGYLHLGHARTFWIAQQRAKQNGGELILRNDDLDSTRYQMKFVEAMLEDMRWFGFEWSEGPDIGGKFYLSLHLFAPRHPAGRDRAARGRRRGDLSGDVPEQFKIKNSKFKIRLAFSRS